ncbi:MAG: AAA family ATPase [Endomicrobium sp.]|jgi:dephospho-CoA kinase|nr:AAA family ATPase [Endomicrobium sp.]
MIIGLTGFYCSGKDTVANYISNIYGYKHFSLSDVLRNMMKSAGIEPIRENLIVFGTKLRRENGNAVLAEKILGSIKNGGKYCVTSIRHSEEVAEFRKRKDFILVNVAAPYDIRFKRMQKRKRPGDPQTLEKFIELEKKESQSSGSGQQIRKTAGIADVVFMNDLDNISVLNKNIDGLLKDLENKISSRYAVYNK